MNEGAIIGMLIASICASIIGIFLILQQLVWQRRHISKSRLVLGIIFFGWPLYVIIGYINTLLYLTPLVAIVCLIVACWKGAHRYAKGHLDREKAIDATRFFTYTGVPVVIGTAMFFLDLLRLLPDFNRLNLSVPVGIILAFLIFAVYGILIYFITRR